MAMSSINFTSGDTKLSTAEVYTVFLGKVKQVQDDFNTYLSKNDLTDNGDMLEAQARMTEMQSAWTVSTQVIKDFKDGVTSAARNL